MPQAPRFRVTRAIGQDNIALEEFGPVDESFAAVIKVDGDTRAAVRAPQTRSSWGKAEEAAFRDAVRQFAAIPNVTPRIGDKGTVTVLFDPLPGGGSRRDDPPGEVVADR